MSAEEGQQYPPAEEEVPAADDPATTTPVRAPELDTCHVAEAIGPAFDPYSVLLRRLFFLSDDKFKYVSVGYYPAATISRSWNLEAPGKCPCSSTINSC
jgi:hypothetical protein